MIITDEVTLLYIKTKKVKQAARQTYIHIYGKVYVILNK